MVVKDVIKQICEAGRFTKGSPEAEAVHQAFTGVYGSEFKPITKESTVRYGRKIENKLYSNHEHGVVSRAMPHVRDVIRNLK
jgi:hypothetical protein